MWPKDLVVAALCVLYLVGIGGQAGGINYGCGDPLDQPEPAARPQYYCWTSAGVQIVVIAALVLDKKSGGRGRWVCLISMAVVVLLQLIILAITAENCTTLVTVYDAVVCVNGLALFALLMSLFLGGDSGIIVQ